MTKGSICHEDVTITYAPNNRAPRYMKQRLPEMTAIDNSAIVELSIMNRTARRKINKEIEELKTLCTNLIYTEYYSQKGRIHIVLKWNILQEKPYVRPQNKSQEILKD